MPPEIAQALGGHVTASSRESPIRSPIISTKLCRAERLGSDLGSRGRRPMTDLRGSKIHNFKRFQKNTLQGIFDLELPFGGRQQNALTVGAGALS